jgi:hypothetical protein
MCRLAALHKKEAGTKKKLDADKGNNIDGICHAFHISKERFHRYINLPANYY